ncbi:MAG TPA: 2-amino-4-hydroxy-6-hydroxymethyldihydropteridine diphosphokinase [Anaerolineales bacterium]|nr:2-amino-4-hydroxy-6-hydroxymethyldihydropteridine diphosphokinase [Anaerolineales bacterium]
MSKNGVMLALGTNLGDRPGNLRSAIAALPPAVTVQEQSFVYETLPWGVIDQPKFLNMVIRGETRLQPQELLKTLKALEISLGRTPSIHYGPRKIDIDILFYDALILDTPELTLPHPHLHERAFVLVPLADLAPEQIHPVLGRSIRALLAEVDTTGVERFG